MSIQLELGLCFSAVSGLILWALQSVNDHLPYSNSIAQQFWTVLTAGTEGWLSTVFPQRFLTPFFTECLPQLVTSQQYIASFEFACGAFCMRPSPKKGKLIYWFWLALLWLPVTTDVQNSRLRYLNNSINLTPRSIDSSGCIFSFIGVTTQQLGFGIDRNGVLYTHMP